MTPGRATVYIGGAVVLAAWLAAASSTPTPGEPQPAPQTVPTAGTEHLASDVQAQSARLRERLAAAPVPQEPRRNPFAFAEREFTPPRVGPAAHALAAAAPVAPLPPPEPDLTLAGVAEQRVALGVMRTAIIVGPDEELYMVREGQTLLDRYTVSAIGADVVELRDALTGLPRRLALR